MSDQEIATAVSWLVTTQRRYCNRSLSDITPLEFGGLLLYPYFHHPGAIAVAKQKIAHSDIFETSTNVCFVHVVARHEEVLCWMKDPSPLFRQCLSFIVLNVEAINEHIVRKKCTHLFPKSNA